MVRIFNDIIDLGNELDPTVLIILNVLVGVHFVAFLVLLIIVCRNMNKSDATIFKEQI
jgi:hypothetical protein